MTNQIFYWKQLTSPADLPKEGESCHVRYKSGHEEKLYYVSADSEWWVKNISHYLCPLTVDNIPEWVEERMQDIANDTKYDEFQDLVYGALKRLASLLIPLINQGKGETESKGEVFESEEEYLEAAGEARRELTQYPKTTTKDSRLIEYIYGFAWQYGKNYHLGDAKKIMERVSQKMQTPEEFIKTI